MQVMLQLGIMIRWTTIARDIIPEEINFYHADTGAMPCLTYRHRLLTPSASASRIVMEGDYDAETFEIATKHMHWAFMEIADYMKLRATSMDEGNNSATEELGSEYCNGSETDGESR